MLYQDGVLCRWERALSAAMRSHRFLAILARHAQVRLLYHMVGHGYDTAGRRGVAVRHLDRPKQRRLHHPGDRLQQRVVSRKRCTGRITATQPPV
jgi:hypothetical protein